MRLLTRSEILDLAQESYPTVSLLLPTTSKGVGRLETPIRLRNLATEAEETLVSSGMKPKLAKKLLDPVRLVSNEVSPLHQGEGLAVFVTDGDLQLVETPYTLAERFVIDRRPSVRGLLPMLSNESFYVLVIDQQHVKLLYGDRASLKEVTVPNMPERIEEVVPVRHPQKQMQSHTAGRQGAAGATVMHGARNLKDEQKEHIHQFCLAIDHAVRPVWEKAQAPVVVAGVDYETQIFREVTHLPVLPETLDGSMKMVANEELGKRAYSIAESVLKEEKSNAVSKFKELHGTGMASTDLKEIVDKSSSGQIATLFLQRDAMVWGLTDECLTLVEVLDSWKPDGQDLLNLTALRVLASQGTVYECAAEEMPAPEALIAATYRY
ncbi:MAG TPA: hypothetical protein VG944_04990 [Fimbriimonas sp.]|nr:hypothetical protein [Fimbriimonas sp.]